MAETETSAPALTPTAAPVVAPVGSTPLYILIAQYMQGAEYKVYGIYLTREDATAARVYGPPVNQYIMEVFSYDRTGS